MMKISDQTVKATKTPGGGQVITWDNDVKGFGLRVTAGGAKSFIFNYRASG